VFLAIMQLCWTYVNNFGNQPSALADTDETTPLTDFTTGASARGSESDIKVTSFLWKSADIFLSLRCSLLFTVYSLEFKVYSL
jgi:hypothetical protein